jgi:hypothetical protein
MTACFNQRRTHRDRSVTPIPQAGFKSTVVKKPEMKSPLVRFERAFDCVSDSATIRNAHSPGPAKAAKHVLKVDEHAKSPVTQTTNRRNIASRAC